MKSMAVHDYQPRSPTVLRFPLSSYVDSVRWLSSPSPLHKSFVVASFDTDTHSPSLQVFSIPNDSRTAKPEVTSSWTPSSRISSLACASSLFAVSTLSTSVHFFITSPTSELLPVAAVGPLDQDFHVGRICGLGLRDGGGECCVTVGEDGRINLLGFDGSDRNGVGHRRVFDGNGIVSYTAVKWASGSEFVTGGVGVGLQWWDLRRHGTAVAQLKDIGNKGKSSGIIHSVDVHPSRKHTCLAGGSSGKVLAWDLRWPKQPVVLSGSSTENNDNLCLPQSEIWEVQFTKSSSSNFSASQILPSMICSEDGTLAILEQGKEPIELLTEPCAINSFDIHWHNPSDIICSLEWESIAILSSS